MAQSMGWSMAGWSQRGSTAIDLPAQCQFLCCKQP
jgi:hypothetical protein